MTLPPNLPDPHEAASPFQQQWKTRWQSHLETCLNDSPDPEWDAFCQNHQAVLRRWFQTTEQPAALLQQWTIAWLYQYNQFIELGPQLLRDLRTTLTAFEPQEDAPLRTWLKHVIAANGNIATVPCVEYSPTLQQSLLPLDAIQDPILDLGCGPEAKLVETLRSQGRQAFGIDRLLLRKAPYLIQTDWFRYTLEPNHWGCILSHMGFSNHFLHHHVRPNGQAEAYARRYMALLQSLRLGASFIYAPGLPFIESLLPKHFGVTRAPIAIREDIAADLRRFYDHDVCYSCRITRLA